LTGERYPSIGDHAPIGDGRPGHAVYGAVLGGFYSLA
jgi:hypothetical protein